MNTRNRIAITPARQTLISTRLLAALALPAVALSGCYVVPVAQDKAGNPYYMYSPVPAIPAPVARATPPAAIVAPAGPVIVPSGPAAQELAVKLYPINDLANQTGVLTGSVTNMMNGKGRFTFLYQGETLVGEATRVANDERKGVASAYGPRGTFARCEYQMSTPQLGAGTCAFSNGAQYTAHIGG